MKGFHPIKHFLTVERHRHQVIKNGFACGIGFHTLFHDLSKFSPKEFIPSSHYYQGTSSPIREERRENHGFSFISFHHTKVNRHHWEYWCDFYRGRIIATNRPYKYIVEYCCDVLSASKTYHPKEFKKENGLLFFQKTKCCYYRTKGTEEFIEWFFTEYAKNGFRNLKKKRTKKKYEEIRSKYPSTRIFDTLDHTYPINEKDR